MTELIPGKRYLWTVEGTADSAGFLDISDDWYLDSDQMDHGTLELLPDPLPTTPGSVIHLSGHGMLMRRHKTDHYLESPWVDSAGLTFREEAVQGADVIFDAGADRA